jgi:hypothetical protein
VGAWSNELLTLTNGIFIDGIKKEKKPRQGRFVRVWLVCGH